jgi:hypothetical protein
MEWRAYTCLSDEALSQAVEVVEELLDADLSLEHFGLHASFDIELDVKNARWLGDAEAAEVS